MKQKLPEADDLCHEMVTLLAPLYFPARNSGAVIETLVSSEFSRARKIVSRKYACDENNEQSPFEPIRQKIEKEIRGRIRIDTHLNALTSMREELIQQVRTAVKKAGGCIGTFYKNQGKHHTKITTEEEYDNSPIVVAKGANLYAYGSYEAATMYDLYIEGDALLCCLNGEGGEDFDLPLETIQTDNLIDVVLWLKQYGFLPDKEDGLMVCEECGSDAVETKAWVRPNENNAFVDHCTEEMSYPDENYCNTCQDHFRLIPYTDFMAQVEAWWRDLELPHIAQIAELRMEDYDPSNNSHAFIQACDEWWSSLTDFAKRKLWAHHKEQ